MSQALVNSFFFAAAAGPPVDPYAANVVLLLRMEGTPGSTVIVDSSPLSTTMTNNAPSDLYLSTAQFKSGTSSLRCAWTGGNLIYSNSSNHELSGDFTIEAWLYLTQAPDTDNIVYKCTPAAYLLWIKDDRTLHLYDGGFKIDGTTAMSLNAWHHVAATRSGTTIRLWLDGVQQGGTYTSSSIYNTAFATTTIGQALGSNTTPAYLDLVRITKVDRYGTASFTPPADY